MNLGLAISSRSGLPPGVYGQYARLAEQQGFAAAFATESGSDALALAQVMAQATQQIAIGTAIANIYLRHPVLMALTAATIDELSGGRLVLGIGTANSAINEAQLGLPADPPLRRMREYLAVLRAVFAGQSVSHDGQSFRLQRFTPSRRPIRPDIPIYIGALLPRMVRLAAEQADGLLLNVVTAAQARTLVNQARSACQERAGSAGFRIGCLIPCAVAADAAMARRAAAETVAAYAAHPAISRLYANGPLGEDMAAVREELARGDREAAVRRVSDPLAEAMVVHGSEERRADQLQRYVAAGVDLPVIFPVAVEAGWDTSIRGAIGAFQF